MPTATKAQLVSIYVSEDARVQGRPVYMAVLELLRTERAAGATVVRGVAGFDSRRQIHSAGIMALSMDLPVKIEWVDTHERVDALLPAVKQLVKEGLITVQEVTVVKRTLPARNDILDQRVSTVMSSGVLSVYPGTPLSEAVSLLLREGYRSLPVVDDRRKVVGIVTDGDLLRNTSLPIRLGLQPALTQEQVQSDIAELQSQGRTVGEIMTMPVVTVTDSATVRHAGALMVQNDLKRLPVVDSDGRLAGIISRVDILHAMSAAEEHPFSASSLPEGQTVEDLMNQDAPYVMPRANLEEIVEALEQSRQQRVVVVNQDRTVIGLITDGDLLRRSMYGRDPSLRQRLRGLIAGVPAEPFDLPTGHECAADLMTTPVIAVEADATLSDALGLMLIHRLKRLPVVDGERRLLGVLGRASVLHALMQESVSPDKNSV
jgi:CBS domain-containing protein